MLSRLSAAVVVLVLGAALMSPADATVPRANSGNLNNQIKQIGEDLDNANAAVSKAMKDYRKAAAALPAARAQLKTAKANLAAATSADQQAQAALSSVNSKTAKTETKLSTTQKNMSSQQNDVSRLIRSVYQQGPMSELSIVLGADTPADFTARIATLASWHASKAALIDSLAKNKELLTQQHKQLQVLAQEKAAKKKVAEARVLDAKAAAAKAKQAQDKVNKIVAAKSAAMKIALKHRNAVKRRYEALKAEQARLRRLAAKAGGKGKNLHSSGSMTWPVGNVTITQYTGWRVHPVYHYRSCHTGVDFGVGYGTPIHAVEDGVVATVGNGGPYGRYTLIAHGDGITSFYAHQSRQAVREGESVKRGEIIGYVGSTGWSTGAHLHFEVRVDGTPYNPLGWFGHAKTKVSCVD